MNDLIPFKANEKLRISHIQNAEFVVQPDPFLPNDPYYEEGKTGAVAQLRETKTGYLWALKIFHPRYQEARNVSYTQNLSRLRLYDIPGMEVTRRIVIDPQQAGDLIQKHSVLKYSLLMPWLEGKTWFEILASTNNGGSLPNAEQSIKTAIGFCNIVRALEQKQCAHCDLCSNNVIVHSDFRVSLIDIDDMYGPGFERRSGFQGGQKGYIHQNDSRDHQWCLEGDRFSAAILIAEMICWYDASFRRSSGQESYFHVNSELQGDSERFKLLLSILRTQTSQQVEDLFRAAWSSKSLDSCPKLEDWDSNLQEIAIRKGIEIPREDRFQPSGGILPVIRHRQAIIVDDQPSSDISSSPISGRRVLQLDNMVEPSKTPSLSQPPATSTGTVVKRRKVQIAPDIQPPISASTPKSRRPAAVPPRVQPSGTSTDPIEQWIAAIIMIIIVIVIVGGAICLASYLF